MLLLEQCAWSLFVLLAVITVHAVSSACTSLVAKIRRVSPLLRAGSPRQNCLRSLTVAVLRAVLLLLYISDNRVLRGRIQRLLVALPILKSIRLLTESDSWLVGSVPTSSCTSTLIETVNCVSRDDRHVTR